MAVSFHEESHSYTNDSGVNYTSVTTLISKYKAPFDAHYWSTYKAIQRVLDAKGEWLGYKKQVGGWENVVETMRMDKTNPNRDAIVKCKKEILLEWEANKEDALSRGTAYHKMREAADRNEGVIIADSVPYEVKTCTTSLEELPDGLYPELLIYNDGWELAGQADWVLKRGKKIDIKDYKTSKKITQTSFQDASMLYPLTEVPDCNFYHYALQLSIYALMLEKKGFEVGKLTVEHVDKITLETIGFYEMPYLRDTCNYLLEYRSEQNRKEKSKRSTPLVSY